MLQVSRLERARAADVRLQMDVKKKFFPFKVPKQLDCCNYFIIIIIIINVMHPVRANYSLGRVSFGQFASQER